ncbi:MAG TPA: AraC family transcriptional regulator [Hydrogenophaga sp.]|nr:AraC family transcriptional regulator [Hydrogenophaga sp.]
MATSLTSSRAFDPGLLPSGTLWQPRASLAACVRATMARSTLGAALSDEQRINHFPATPLCSLSWWFEGSSFSLLPTQAGAPCALTNTRVAMPGRWVLAGPQTRSGASWCPGPVHAMMVLFMPDALHLMTGLEPGDLIDRFVDANTVLPPEWIAMCQQVQDASDDAQRMALLEDFLEPRWQACRPALPLQGHRYADWAMHLAQRAATSAPGRSLRQLERRIKRWAGLPLRELRGMGRSEQAFFRVVQAQTEGTLHWAHIAADSGYADQSHLCRETRRITGFSPDALRDGIEHHEGFWAYRLWM